MAVTSAMERTIPVPLGVTVKPVLKRSKFRYLEEPTLSMTAVTGSPAGELFDEGVIGSPGRVTSCASATEAVPERTMSARIDMFVGGLRCGGGRETVARRYRRRTSVPKASPS